MPLIAFQAARSLARGQSSGASLPTLLAQSVVRRIKRLIARSQAFNTVLAEALGRFVAEWSEAARPLLTARAVRLLHACAGAVGVGLIAGLYLRGIALDYQAGWESTFLDAHQVRALVAAVYGPASALTGMVIPDAGHLAALRVEGGHGGESAARWIHLLAATVALFVVLPRLLLALGITVLLWRRARNAPLPSGLVPYFRSAFARVQDMGACGIVAVMPYAYEPSPGALAALRRLLPDGLGEGLAVEVNAGVRYGDEDSLLRNLGDRGGAIADIIVVLFSLAATPEDENHGAVIAGVRDWLARARRHTPTARAGRRRSVPGADGTERGRRPHRGTARAVARVRCRARAERLFRRSGPARRSHRRECARHACNAVAAGRQCLTCRPRAPGRSDAPCASRHRHRQST